LQTTKGYDGLTQADQRLFDKFLSNFLDRWEFPKEWQPVSVFRTKDKANGKYLRVDFTRTYYDGTKRESWFHVIDENTWY